FLIVPRRICDFLNIFDCCSASLGQRSAPPSRHNQRMTMKLLTLALSLTISSMAAAKSVHCYPVLKGMSQKEKIEDGTKITITTFTVEVTTCGKVSSEDFKILVNGMDHSGYAHTFLIRK